MEAVTWDLLWKKGGFNRFPNEELVRWASTLEEGSKVLEVGCGAGANLQALESFGLQAWGVDISTEAIDASVALTSASRLAPVSAVELPFANGEFDAVCDVQCFQHLTQDELPLAYKEAARVLRPDGAFFEVFLVKGRKNFPDLAFCDIDDGAIIDAGFAHLWMDRAERTHHGRFYSYRLVECVKRV